VVIISSNTFISELTTFELIITTFEHNYVYLTPILRINDFILNVVVSARYSAIACTASCYTTTMGAPRGALGPWSPNYFNSICNPPFCQFYKKVVLRLSEHGDVIETLTIKFVSPKVF